MSNGNTIFSRDDASWALSVAKEGWRYVVKLNFREIGRFWSKNDAMALGRFIAGALEIAGDIGKSRGKSATVEAVRDALETLP